jgi:ATP-dependent Lhr-like helicase
LARIHRLTLDGLRRRIQPVEPEVYLRFLLRHQHVVRDQPFSGPAAVRDVLAQLQGFELPAGAWESRVLGARVDHYDPAWLDQLFLSGELVWGRLRGMKRDEADEQRMAALTRTVPLSLVLRDDLPWLLTDAVAEVARLWPNSNGTQTLASSAMQRTDRLAAAGKLRAATLGVYETLAQRGALFFQQLAAAASLLPAQLEDALRELAALGLVTCDAYVAIRAIADRKRSTSRGRDRWRRAADSAAKTRIGRWSCFPGDVPACDADQRIERWCRQLLARYGVVFRDLLVRESAAPPWRQLVGCFRRMELRGEARGGRFVSGVAGEQFASETAVAALRQLRDQPADDEHWLAISAADPLNLVGIVTPGARVSATHKSALVLQGGRLIACKQAAQIDFFADVDPAQRQLMIHALHLGRRDDDRPSHIRRRWSAADADPALAMLPQVSTKFEIRNPEQIKHPKFQ